MAAHGLLFNTEEFLSKFWHKVTQSAVGLLGSGARKQTAALTKSLALGLGANYIIDAYLSYRDFKFEEERLKLFFEPEIAAKLGKTADSVTADDLNALGRDNPAIGEALTRNKKTAWVGFGANVLALTAAVVATTAILASASTFMIILGSVAIGFPIFWAVDKAFEWVGKKVTGLDEPSLKEVSRNPSLQHELSVPSQIHYLENLRNHRQTISQEQVFTLFVKANPDLAAAVESRYGGAFAALADDKRAQAIMEMGPRFDLENITQDLNHRLIRVQELAFISSGRQSGVQKLETPHATELERLKSELVAANQQIGAMAKEHAGHLKDKVHEGAQTLKEKGQDAIAAAKEKLHIGKPAAENPVPEEPQNTMQQTAAPEPQPEPMMSRPPQPVLGPQTEMVAKRRQQQVIQL